MSWKLARKYFTLHQILPFYLKTFSESTNKCQSWNVLVDEPKIGTQISYNAPNFSFLPENVFWKYKNLYLFYFIYLFFFFFFNIINYLFWSTKSLELVYFICRPGQYFPSNVARVSQKIGHPCSRTVVESGLQVLSIRPAAPYRIYLTHDPHWLNY